MREKLKKKKPYYKRTLRPRVMSVLLPPTPQQNVLVFPLQSSRMDNIRMISTLVFTIYFETRISEIFVVFCRGLSNVCHSNT